jgi:cyanate permease
MSSKYTTTKELVKGLNSSSTNLMKVVGAFVKPKSMTNHSKRPSLYLKVVFHTSVGSMGTWWEPDFSSILLKNFSPLSSSRRSSIMGIGYHFLTVIMFNSMQSMQSRQVPSFFYTSTIGLPQGEELGFMCPF